MQITTRPATEGDFPAISRFDLTYPAGRYLEINWRGTTPEHTLTLCWREHDASDENYASYDDKWLRDAATRADLFLLAEAAGSPAGLLMILLPAWTDAADISDLAVHRPLRGRGVGAALVQAASRWARRHSRRALWVEPRANNAQAIEFYLRQGFRLSGFNDRLYSNEDDAPGKQTIYMHLELTTRPGTGSA